ncbi:lipocalin-like domain-containing protein [Bacteroides salyersiae]|uniref:lipocalin family protein n=1 Tax=Bacteroides salyersiae TaxID=291644 RepID=UPI0021CEEDD1|nr:lipocalin family protein [Bacteroides salyersiae]
MVLEEGGKASSINMATLLYDTWKQEGASLILSGTSKGNHQTLHFTDTLKIESLTQDSLILKREKLILRYAREQST